MKTIQNKMITVLATMAVLTVGIKSSVAQPLAVLKTQSAHGQRIPVKINTLASASLPKNSAAVIMSPKAVNLFSKRPAASLGRIVSGARHSTIANSARLTRRQLNWINASLQQRIRLAETLGEKGTRDIARLKGLRPLLDGLKRTLPQGPDQVYRGLDGMIHVFEAKGGSSQLGHAYGYPQGSPEWAVKSAERMLRSSKASVAERRAAKAIIEAAAKGKLKVSVVRVSHVLGEPTSTVVQQSVNCTDEATRLAKSSLDDLGRAATRTTDDLARAGLQSCDDVVRAGSNLADDAVRVGAVTKLIRSPGVGAGVVTFAVDSGISVYQYLDGDINKSELAEEIQDASIKAAAVGLAVQAVYILSATPSGLVVVGVAIVTYVAADAVVTHFREKHSGRYLKVEDLRGIASDAFLDNLQPTIEDALKSKSARHMIAD